MMYQHHTSPSDNIVSAYVQLFVYTTVDLYLQYHYCSEQ